MTHSPTMHSGWHTEDLVEKYQVTREAQDRWALRLRNSVLPRRKPPAISNRQIVPVEVPGKKGPTAFDKDEAQSARHDAGNPRPSSSRRSSPTAPSPPAMRLD